MPLPKSQCPVTGCTRLAAGGKLMCLPCWRDLPDPLAREVNRTWRAYLRAPRLPERYDERTTALAEYRAATRVAIAYVSDLQPVEGK